MYARICILQKPDSSPENVYVWCPMCGYGRNVFDSEEAHGCPGLEISPEEGIIYIEQSKSTSEVRIKGFTYQRGRGE